jgi:hypothetical protein
MRRVSREISCYGSEGICSKSGEPETWFLDGSVGYLGVK